MKLPDYKEAKKRTNEEIIREEYEFDVYESVNVTLDKNIK